ncbi:MAG: amidohydrolase family protein, partial [Clostridia bacterium]|nr:amidohydrolase family protein [Clostridia bacterium]
MTGNVLKGDICYAPEPDHLITKQNAYLVIEDDLIVGVFDELPECYHHYFLYDCTGRLVIPGMVDLHTHAPQYPFCGTGMDYELLDWLNLMTFPEEIRYADPAYAERSYRYFSKMLRDGATTRVVVFGTTHLEGTLTLMECMETSGLISYVGKVNMDRNAPKELLEPDAETAIRDTEFFIEESLRRGFKRTKPIITPRFAPSCSGELLAALGELNRRYHLPVQSHLSENPKEIELVSELFPEAAFYGDVYDRYGLFGRDSNTVMAHCVYSSEAETQRMLENGVFIAHCASSNMNIASGIAPIRRYMEMGLR